MVIKILWIRWALKLQGIQASQSAGQECRLSAKAGMHNNHKRVYVSVLLSYHFFPYPVHVLCHSVVVKRQSGHGFDITSASQTSFMLNLVMIILPLRWKSIYNRKPNIISSCLEQFLFVNVQKHSSSLSHRRFGNWSPCYANQATALRWSGPRPAMPAVQLSVSTTCSTSKAQNHTVPLNTHLTCWAWPWTASITARWMQSGEFRHTELHLSMHNNCKKQNDRFKANHIYVQLSYVTKNIPNFFFQYFTLFM